MFLLVAGELTVRGLVLVHGDVPHLISCLQLLKAQADAMSAQAQAASAQHLQWSDSQVKKDSRDGVSTLRSELK